MSTERRTHAAALAEMFYELQARHIGAPRSASLGRNDETSMLGLASDWSPREVREVLCWFWLHPSAEYWRDRVADVAGFARAFPELELQALKTVPPWWTTPPASGTQQQGLPRVGARNLVRADIDAVHAAALELAETLDDPTPVPVEEARAQARAAVARPPERKDIDN